MRKGLALFVGLLMTAALVMGCGSSAASSGNETAGDSEEASGTESSTEATGSESETAIDELNVVYLMPATSSQYWYDYMYTGAINAAQDIEEQYGVKVNLTTAGPAEENETDAYIRSFENVIATQPDAIITATLIPDGTNDLVKEAYDQGIYVDFMSCGLEDPAFDEYWGSFFYCEMGDQGVAAAQAFLAALEAKGIEPKGIVGVHTSVLVPSLMPRIDEFVAYLNEHAPELECQDTLFNENVVTKAQSNVEDQIALYGDQIVGFYGSDNITGDGIALAIQNSELAGKIVAVAVDSDDLEVEALRNGILDAIVVQTPYQQSYDAMFDVYNYLVNGISQDKHIITPSYAVTTENMDDEEMAPLLDPTLYAR